MNRTSVMDLERSAWDQVMNVTVTDPFLCTKRAA
jgi:NAD(P)-dependent dehydrogenase (short-subunit alcohol dehydrogenase family)